MFYCKSAEQMAYPNLLVWLPVIMICLLHKVNDFCTMVRKNHITADITESVRIIFTIMIHSYGNSNVKLKREKINPHTTSG